MFPTSRFSSLAVGLHVPAAWNPIIPRHSFVDSIPLERRASYSTQASTPTWAPGIYTLQDLIRRPPSQPPKANEFQRSDTHEYVNTSLQAVGRAEGKLSRNEGQGQFYENFEESASRPPTDMSTSHMGQRVLEPNQELVEIKLFKLLRSRHTVSSEEIRSRAIGNFIRGCVKNLFESVRFGDSTVLKEFVKLYDPGYPLSRQTISNMRYRPTWFRYLPETKTSLDFISHVQRYFPGFDGEELYALSGTRVSYTKILLVREKQIYRGYRSSL